MKRKNARNLFLLLLIVLALYLLDNTRLNKYIGYNKVKEYIKEDINIFGLSKRFFGEKLLNFYNQETHVASSVISEERYLDGYIVYQSDNLLYSNTIGTVVKIEKHNDIYSVTISKVTGNIYLSNIKVLYVNLYQKIEADTLIGIIDGYYYYEEN